MWTRIFSSSSNFTVTLNPSLCRDMIKNVKCLWKHFLWDELITSVTVEPKWKFNKTLISCRCLTDHTLSCKFLVMQKHGETAPIADKSNDMTENKLGWF